MTSEDSTARALFEGGDETPTIELRVFRDGKLIHTELCESEEQASLAVDTWVDFDDGITYEIDDLADHDGFEGVLEPELPEFRDDGYAIAQAEPPGSD